MSTRAAAPAGYASFTVGKAEVVVVERAAEDLRAALTARPTLHAWAERQPDARPMQGRATAWSARLPQSAIEVVVRHATHGGLFAPLTGDLFLRPGRAPHELAVALRLREAGVPTPRLVAHCTYPAGPMLCRADVATELLPAGGDLPALWETADPATRDLFLTATGALLRKLALAAAHHEDLNAKNIHLARVDGAWTAYVLDVDRVAFHPEAVARVADRNFARLARSLTKRREREAMPVTDADIARLATLAGVAHAWHGAAA